MDRPVGAADGLRRSRPEVGDLRYVIGAGDVGHTFRALIYANNDDGWVPIVSAPTRVVTR